MGDAVCLKLRLLSRLCECETEGKGSFKILSTCYQGVVIALTRVRSIRRSSPKNSSARGRCSNDT